MYSCPIAAFHTQNGGRCCSKGVTTCPPSIARRSRSVTPCQPRVRLIPIPYSVCTAARLRHRSSGVPVVPLVRTCCMRRTDQSSATNARGARRSSCFSRIGQFSSSSQDVRSPRRRRAAHSSR